MRVDERPNSQSKHVPLLRNSRFDEMFACDYPNAHLREFVVMHQGAHDHKESHITPLSEMVSGSKNDPLYMLHTYWAKKPFDAIRAFIEHYTVPGEIILDPFAGCGGTALVAALCGRYSIASDISPSAMKIAAGYCNNHPFEELYGVRQRLLSKMWERIGWLQKLGEEFIRSIVISEAFRCIKCFREIPLAKLGIEKTRDACPYCAESVNTRTLEFIINSAEPYQVDLQREPLSHRSCATFIVGESPRHDALLRELYSKIETSNLSSLPRDIPVPDRLLDLGGRLRSSGTLHVSQLHSKRQALILNGMREVIAEEKCSPEARRSLWFLFSAILLNSTQMYRARAKGGIAGAYYVPPVRREINSFRAFVEKYDALLALEHLYSTVDIGGSVCVSCQSACDLSAIPGNSIDYIFTDPPYADTMPFGALNAIYDFWFEVEPDYLEDEAIGDKWEPMMRAFFAEASRVLKPGKWLTLCYHDTAEGTWSKVQDLAAEAGLLSDLSSCAVGIDANQKAYQQTVADKVTKRDLIINFRKPKPGEITAQDSIVAGEDQATFNENVRLIIRDFLGANPGSSKDRIYDLVVSRMVRRKRMEAHNFGEILRQVAEEAKAEKVNEETGRWYLKESGSAILDFAETVREDKAAEELGTFLKKHSEEHPSDEGVHYSDLFEHYIYAVKDKPRRTLADWLLDYFYKTDSGTYRLPATSEEERAKAEGRAKGVNRRVKRYLAWLDQGVAIPERERPNAATLAEWIRHCRRNAQYDQGKLLYEKGGLDVDALPEREAVAAEEDYQVCVRMLERSAGTAAAKGAQGRRKRAGESE